MTSEVFILGQIGKAVFQQDHHYYLLDFDAHTEPLECRAGDVSLYFDSGSEVTILPTDEIDIASIRDTLDFETRAYRALSMTLGGLDNELSPQSRRLSVEAAEELLQDDSVRAFVRKRLLARLLPITADVQGAIKYSQCTDASRASSIYKEILTSQPAIEVLLNTWKELSEEFFDSKDEAANGEKSFIDSGIFAEMVASLTANNLSQLNSVVASDETNRDLVKAIPGATHLLNSLRRITLSKSESLAKTVSALEQRRISSDRAGVESEFDDSKVSVFFVESDEQVRKLLVEYSSLVGFNVEAYGDAAQSLSILADPLSRKLPDLVVVDLDHQNGMMTGLHLIQELTRGNMPGVIVAISAAPGDLLEAIRLGAFAIQKPFGLDSFMTKMNHLAELGRRRKRYSLNPARGDRTRSNRTVFLSYNSEDKTVANAIRLNLEARGVGVWYSGLVELGDKWERMNIAIDEVGVFVAVITDEYTISPQCNAELGRFFKRLATERDRLILLPVLYKSPSGIKQNALIARILKKYDGIRVTRAEDFDGLTALILGIQNAVLAMAA